MANTKSAQKAVRKIERKTLINKIRKSKVRTLIKKVEKAILSGNKELALNCFKEAQPQMHKSVSKNVFKSNTISRKLSKLSMKIKLMNPS